MLADFGKYVQRSATAKRILRAIGASDVNDSANLAPACKRCNDRKADKGGLWILRGLVGRYRAWWALSYTAGALLALGALAVIARALVIHP